MQVVSEEVSACVPTMTVENCKERALWPPIALLLWRLLHVEYNRHTVFIVVAHDALIGVRRVRLDHAILLDRVLGRFKVGQLDMR